MKEEDSLLDALFDSPHDHAAWLVYADWLEERGDCRAEYLRLYAQLRKLSVRDPQHGEINARLSALRPGVDVHWLALIDGGQRFSLLWTPQFGRTLAQRGLLGQPLRLLGSGDVSVLHFTSAGVQPGDYLYPVYFEGGGLYAVGRLRVCEMLDQEQFREQHPGEERWLGVRVAGEIALGEVALPLQLNQAVPRAVLERFAITGKRGARRLPVVDGKLTSAAALRGVRRLERRTARDLDFVLAGRPAPEDGRSLEGVRQASLFDAAGEGDE